ncbi:unnamed protein product, partial [Oncorhynchus mykiss]
MTCTEEARGWIRLPSQVLTLLSLFLAPFPSLPSPLSLSFLSLSPFPSLPSLSHIFPLALPLSVGKAFVPKQRPIESRQEEVTTLDPELEEALSSATDTELCDLAAILGVHTLVTSTQSYDGTSSKDGGYNNVVKGEKMNPVFDEPPNPTNVDDTLQRIKNNDAALTEVNLNNIK